MGKKNQDSFRKGIIELVILSVLSEGDYYGYEISQKIKKRSEQQITIRVGSMYPTLYRLEELGYVSSQKVLIGKRMTRVYYHLEDSGHEYYKEVKEDYYHLHMYVRKVLEYSEKEGKCDESI